MSPDNASPENITRLLERAAAGDETAHHDLFQAVYGELRRIARGQRRRANRGDDTMNTTALVHEAYLKLMGPGQPEWERRAHFFAVAARAMRQILIDQARRAAAAKRGGEQQRVTLDRALERGLGSAMGPGSSVGPESLIALGESLDRLEQSSPQHSRIVECRFFGDMTIEDTAQALGVSPATVKRGWALARAWLYRDLQEQLG
jgi:RNA polymerase sigma factor (TIGR02999 family)